MSLKVKLVVEVEGREEGRRGGDAGSWELREEVDFCAGAS